jgi:hypothetical protein
MGASRSIRGMLDMVCHRTVARDLEAGVTEAIDPRAARPRAGERRFHAIAARIATRGERWPYSDVGKRTRVETERDGSSSRGAGIDELPSRVPGRRTLVEAEASRWEPAGAAAIADVPGRRTLVEAEASRWEPTATAAIDQVIAAATDETREGIGATAPSALGTASLPPRASSASRCPPSTAWSRAFGRASTTSRSHVDSGEVPHGDRGRSRESRHTSSSAAVRPESATANT